MPGQPPPEFAGRNPPPALLAPPSFACLRCGSCCRHAGDVRLEPGEAEIIASSLGMDVLSFTSRYTRLRDDRRGITLLEHPDGSCIFLSNSLCLIHSAKPRQCRGFPFSWQYDNLDSVCPAAAAIPVTRVVHHL